MIALRTLITALLLLPLACSESEVHAHVSGDADSAELAPCCSDLEAEVDEADQLAALAPEGVNADESSVEVRDMTMSELLGDTPELVAPDDGTGLPNLGELPEFALIDETGADFTRADMLGDVWVVDFIFTRCAGPCPDMSKEFMALQEQGVPARFLSITVDPGYDTPQVLNEYRTNWGAEADRWKLLTGANDSIHSLGNDGFKLPTNATETPMEGMPRAFHSGKFALVDQAGLVRGYYSFKDKLELAELAKQAAALAELTPG